MGKCVWTAVAAALLLSCSDGGNAAGATAGGGHAGEAGKSTSAGTETGGSGAQGGNSGSGSELAGAANGGSGAALEGGAGGADDGGAGMGGAGEDAPSCEVPSAAGYDCTGFCPQLGVCELADELIDSPGVDRSVIVEANTGSAWTYTTGPGLCVRVTVEPEAFHSIGGSGERKGSCMAVPQTLAPVNQFVFTTQARGWIRIETGDPGGCALTCP